MNIGAFDAVLVDYCNRLALSIHVSFMKNPVYDTTNYIYCAKEYFDDDIILMYRDLVFDRIIASATSCMTVSSTLTLLEKNFKALVYDSRVLKVGIDFFDGAMVAQTLYKLLRGDWKIWLDNIVNFCEYDSRKSYA